jgi:murein DD-endopeptidase MepM/ murein hydrolase activator NlpD
MEFSRLRFIVISLVLIIIALLPEAISRAQEEQPSAPVYIVQEGDTIWDIAQRFGIPWEDLARENNISDPGQLVPGDELIIPGFTGVGGVLVTVRVPLGENLRSLSRRYNLPEESIIRLNHITSSGELLNGYNLVVPEANQTVPPNERMGLANGQSLIEMALLKGVNPWALVAHNRLEGTWNVVPGDVLLIPCQEAVEGPGGLPGEITNLEVNPQPLTQGNTAVIRLESAQEFVVQGSLNDFELNFFKNGDGEYVALLGVHAMTPRGVYPLTVEGELSNGIPFGFSQMVSINPGEFIYESLQVDEETIDPENTAPEDEIWNALAETVTPDKLWKGVFQNPVAPSECGPYTSMFGNRRSYNGSPYDYFHTGLDFCYNYNNEVNEIYAPADGVVVFAGPMVVRGKATMIDHGWGIYSAYMHQEEILVEVGERVEAGQVIGIVGQTGRVNGPHLHLEIWVGGVQVDPLDWLERAFP